jgi:hypothetical protein
MKIKILVFWLVAIYSYTCDYKRLEGKVCLLQRFISTLNMKIFSAVLNIRKQGILPQKAININNLQLHKLIKELTFKRVNSLKVKGLSTNP